MDIVHSEIRHPREGGNPASHHNSKFFNRLPLHEKPPGKRLPSRYPLTCSFQNPGKSEGLANKVAMVPYLKLHFHELIHLVKGFGSHAVGPRCIHADGWPCYLMGMKPNQVKLAMMERQSQNCRSVLKNPEKR